MSENQKPLASTKKMMTNTHSPSTLRHKNLCVNPYRLFSYLSISFGIKAQERTNYL